MLIIGREPPIGYHMGIRANHPGFFEKSVASVIDVASVLVAYNIGMDRLGMAYGFIYAGMDAFIVVWMSRPITGMVRRLNPARRGRRAKDARSTGVAPPAQGVAAASAPGSGNSTGGSLCQLDAGIATVAGPPSLAGKRL